NLNNLPLEELIGSLMTYEMVHNAHDEHVEHNYLPKNERIWNYGQMNAT
ncbi:unnamed protein product, partial [Musa acuminata subsp. malaccensis]